MSAGRAAAAIGAGLCLVPIWASGHLPMVDLAQHAAQIALWTHRDDPLFFPPDVYRFHWFTPYLGAYVLARAFASLFGVATALKLTVSVAAAAIAGSSGDLRTKLRGGLFLAIPFPLVAAWALTVWLGEAHVRTPIRWTGLPSRLYRTPAALVAILLLTLLRMPESSRARRGVVALLLVLASAWTVHLAARFRGYDREMAGFDRILEKTEPGKVLRLVAFDQTSRAVPGYPLFWNAGAW